jgi:hypothetical protein
MYVGAGGFAVALQVLHAWPNRTTLVVTLEEGGDHRTSGHADCRGAMPMLIVHDKLLKCSSCGTLGLLPPSHSHRP